MHISFLGSRQIHVDWWIHGWDRRMKVLKLLSEKVLKVRERTLHGIEWQFKKRQTHSWEEGIGLESLASSEAREVTCLERGHKVWKRKSWAELVGIGRRGKSCENCSHGESGEQKPGELQRKCLVYVQLEGLLHAVLADDAKNTPEQWAGKPWPWGIEPCVLSLMTSFYNFQYEINMTSDYAPVGPI